MAKKSSELKAKLKKADPIIRKYIAELEKRNAKRQGDIASLEADKVERDGRIEALKAQPKEKKVDVRYNLPDAGLVGTASDLLKQIK